MKARRPIGVIRLLQPLLGRGRGARRRPLVPMIWRRRARLARSALEQKAARPVPAIYSHALNLTLVWPAATAARTAPLRTHETRLREIARTGREGAIRETRRLTNLVERLWLRGAAAPAPGVAPATGETGRTPAPAVGAAPEARQRGPDAAPAGIIGSPPAAMAPHLWRRARMNPSRGTSPPIIGGRADARPDGTGDRRVRTLGRPRAAAIWRERPLAGGAGREAASPATPARAPASPTRRAPPRVALVWRNEVPGGGGGAPIAVSHPGRTPRIELVWRSAPAGEAAHNEARARGPAPAASDRPGESAIRAERPAVPAPAAAQALQPAEMSRLVDEVVRRLDRIGRDERLRRGI